MFKTRALPPQPIAFQKMFLVRIEGGDYTFRISPTDNTAKNIFLKAIDK